MQRRNIQHAVKALRMTAEDQERHNLDLDVQGEAQRMEARCQNYVRLHSGATTQTPNPDTSTNYAVEMYGLGKTYKRGGLVFGRQKPFLAVRGNWLGIHESE